MRKMMLLAAMVALAALMMAATPAMADDWDWNDDDKNNHKKHDDDWNNHKKHDDDWNNHHNRFFFDDDKFDHFDEDDFCHFFECDDFDEDDFGDFGDFEQDAEQDVESGDVDQTFVVTNTGDNSNQCVGIQGAANTGNAQNQTSLSQIGSDADDFDFDDGGSNIDASPTNTTTCDQEVNQAATAYDGGEGYDYNYYNYYDYDNHYYYYY
jgi:hypothetical protein